MNGSSDIKISDSGLFKLSTKDPMGILWTGIASASK